VIELGQRMVVRRRAAHQLPYARRGAHKAKRDGRFDPRESYLNFFTNGPIELIEFEVEAASGFDRRTRFNSPAHLPPAPIFSSPTIAASPEWSSRASHLPPGFNECHTSHGMERWWGLERVVMHNKPYVRSPQPNHLPVNTGSASLTTNAVRS
jgi:hypothetical protein